MSDSVNGEKEKIGTESQLLFITWDGPQTQYLGRLFLPVFEQMVFAGYSTTILQFSSAGKGVRQKIWSQCDASDIQYFSIPVVKRLGMVGALLSALRGAGWLARRLAKRDFDVIVVRSIVPALVFLFTWPKRGVPLVYDSDGLPVEERLEFEGMHENGLFHRVLLWVERVTLGRAAAIVSRSSYGSHVLQGRARGDVSQKVFLRHNNGVGRISHESLSPEAGSRPGKYEDELVLAYVGSWGQQYAPDEMLTVVRAIKQKLPHSKFRVFSGDGEAVEKDLRRYGLFDLDWVSVEEVNFDEVHELLKRCDIGLAFRLSSAATRSVYPLKVADYLFAGLPIVGNMVGDMENELVDDGVFLDVADHDLDEIVRWCVGIQKREATKTAHTCVSLAHTLYRLESTASVYLKALEHAHLQYHLQKTQTPLDLLNY